MSGLDVAELTRELVRFETVNPPGNEAPPLRHLGTLLEAEGFHVSYQEIADNRANLIVRFPGELPGGLALSGHMDVVHPGESTWTHPPFEAALVGGRIIGRGSADMKGGVASMAAAMVRLLKIGFRPRKAVILVVSSGEEVDTVGARLLASSRVLQGVETILVGEPTGLDVLIAEKGVLWLRIVVWGKTAHGAMPHLGTNAISYIAHVVARLELRNWKFDPSPMLGDPTLSVNTISGGVKTNVVADRAEVTVDMRLVPGQEPRAVIAWIEQVLEDTKVKTGLDVRTELTVLQDMPAVETDANDPTVQVVVKAAAQARGSEPSVSGVAYGTDGAILAPAYDAKLIIFGPGRTDQLHQPNEYVEVEQLEQAVAAYGEIIQSLAG